jgi:hypothetical protein
MSSLTTHRSRRTSLRIQLALLMAAAGFGLSRTVLGGGWLWAAAAAGFAGMAGYTLMRLGNNRRASFRAEVLTDYRRDEDTPS